MAVHSIQDVVPYAANFSIVVVLLAAMGRKPLKKYIYQRHERMKDSFQSAAEAHGRAATRLSLAKEKISQLPQEEERYLSRERQALELEKKEILEKAEQECARLVSEAERMAGAEQEEASDRVKGRFVDLVVKEAEHSLRHGLKKDDHHAILKRAQSSIEVGIHG